MNAWLSDNAILADDEGGFSFAGFQQTFNQGWDFAFPNLVMLLLCVGIVWFVDQPQTSSPGGHGKFHWARLGQGPQAAFREFAKFLDEAGISGSKFLPVIALLIAVLIILNVFSVIRVVVGGLLPPHLNEQPAYRYVIGLAKWPEPMFRLAGQDNLWDPKAIYDRLIAWENRIRGNSEEPEYFDVTNGGGEMSGWEGYMGDIRFLAAVALLALGVALWKRRWWALLRFPLVLSLLALVFAYCLAKRLYAGEEMGYAVIRNLERTMEADEKDDDTRAATLARGLERLQGVDVVEPKITSNSPNNAWWSWTWFTDGAFYGEAPNYFWGGSDAPHKGIHMAPEKLEKLRKSLPPNVEVDGSHNPERSPAEPSPTAGLDGPVAKK